MLPADSARRPAHKTNSLLKEAKPARNALTDAVNAATSRLASSVSAEEFRAMDLACQNAQKAHTRIRITCARSALTDVVFAIAAIPASNAVLLSSIRTANASQAARWASS